MGVIRERNFMFQWKAITHPCGLSDSSSIHCVFSYFSPLWKLDAAVFYILSVIDVSNFSPTLLT